MRRLRVPLLTAAFRGGTDGAPSTLPLAPLPCARSLQGVSAVVANGSPTEISLPCTLDVFLRQLGLPPRSVVVELNGEPVSPSEFDTRPLADGDRLEVVRIVAGG
jgi:sulfur carrier protein